ncbi:MAG: hypothetical protein Q9173_006890 [Seirophora scorigena]
MLISRTSDGCPPRREQRREFTVRRNQAPQPTDAYRERTQDKPGRSMGTYYRSINLGAVDARDLAAVPNPTPPPPGRSVSDRIPAGRAPLDARNLAARQPSDGPRIVRTSAASRDDQTPRIISRRDPSDRQYQGGSTNASHTRNRAPPSQSRGPRPNTGSKPKKKPTGPRSGGYAGGGKGKPINVKPSEDEMQYLQARERPDGPSDFRFISSSSKATSAPHLKKGTQTYTPAAMTLDTLEGMGPALACGERGMRETVTERLLEIAQEKSAYDDRIEALARKWSEGIFCHFSSKQEKADTLRTVERQLAGTGDNAALDEQEEKEKLALVDKRMQEEGEKLAARLLGGEYFVGKLGTGPTAELLQRYTGRNESYRAEDGVALAGKIGTLLPMKKPAAATTAHA